MFILLQVYVNLLRVQQLETFIHCGDKITEVEASDFLLFTSLQFNLIPGTQAGQASTPSPLGVTGGRSVHLQDRNYKKATVTFSQMSVN